MSITPSQLKRVRLEIRSKLFEKYPNDYFHLLRVSKLAKIIQNIESGNLHVIEVAALVHDLCRPWELESGKSHFGTEALHIIRQFLEDCKLEEEDIIQILELVKRHDEYDWTDKKNDKSLELKIIQDADNLDAMGAIGISRVFAFGGAYKVPIYIADEKLHFENDFVEGTGKKKSSIAHFYEKLLKLKDNMNTQTGKKIAEKRHLLMLNYLDHFFKEFSI